MSQAGVTNVSSQSGIVTSVTGTNGVTASPTTGAVVVSGVDATTSTVGVASFNPAEFTVSGGEVSLISSGGGIVSIDGDSGSVTGTTVSLIAKASPTTLTFTATSATEMQLEVTDTNNNTIIGYNSGTNGAGYSDNTALGSDAINSLSTGYDNTMIGYNVAGNMNTGFRNVAVGKVALAQLTSGSYNVAIGYAAMNPGVTSGSNNICIGQGAGYELASTESNNILIGDYGTVGESNVTKIGFPAITTTCYLQGISGVTVTGSPVYCSTAGQLGTFSVSSFSAYLSSQQNNATGNGATYSVVFDSVTYDALSDYNNSTGTFTCRNTGIHLFAFYCYALNCTIASAMTLEVVTTSQTYRYSLTRAAGSQNFSSNMQVFANMTAGDTATFAVAISGEAGNTDSIYGDNSNKYDATYVQGRWMGPY